MNEIKNKRVCYHCVNEEFLKIQIKRVGKIRKCSYCEEKTNSITLLELADKIDVAFEQYYQRSSQEPTSWEYHLMSDKESNYHWDRHGSPVVEAIMKAAEIEENIASDIQEVLGERFFDFELAAMGEETEFETESFYEWKSPDDEYWKHEWEEFERRLKTETRHFNQFGLKLLDDVFDGIDQMRTVDGKSLIRVIGPNTDIPFLLRARVFQSDDRLQEALSNPDRHLGPPPQQSALSGRMNARGISMFYSAIEEQVAIAEVRPPVGSKVVVTNFKVRKKLKLLDLSAVNKVNTKGSIFDEKHLHRLQRDIFLRRLSKLMSNPVMPDDEPMDYLITQAIADYLATESKITFDGIMYPSVQVNNEHINVVLFYKSAKVFPITSTLKVDLGSYTDEGWEWSYSLKKGRVKSKKKMEPIYHDDLRDVHIPIFKDANKRECTLEVDVDVIKIHHITGVNYRAEEHNVYTY